MADRMRPELGAVQETLFIPLAARARETARRRPALRDPKAVEMARSIDFDTALYGRGWGGFVAVLRTVIFDWWVREFLARHPSGTVIELGAGLNTRFERTDNGTAHWIELDLPDTIELRRRFFGDTGRRQMIAASLLGENWMETVERRPGPYLFVSEGVLVYLKEEAVTRTLARVAARFPGAMLAFDTYSRVTFDQQHKTAARRGMTARWAWACDDPRSLERLGLRLVESATITRPPKALRASLPFRYRSLLPLADPVLGRSFALSLFRAGMLGGCAGARPPCRRWPRGAGPRVRRGGLSVSDHSELREDSKRIPCRGAKKRCLSLWCLPVPCLARAYLR